MKKFKIEDLKIESFVTKLSSEEMEAAKAGALATTDYTGVTSKCNPKTDEAKVDTCQDTASCKPIAQPIDPPIISPPETIG